MSSNDTDEYLVVYGTPVEPLEEDEIPNKKPRLLEDQVVRDKQGRRRFHGAFTGGFSAGFFNTVGSLEGWAPSSFKSSKSKKQEIVQQKPEDFMDEEDMSEFGIAPVVLTARQDYKTEINKEVTTLNKVQTLGTYVLQDVLKHVRETIGIKLLKKMGWKPGQGVGPRLNKNEKKASLKKIQKTYGCQLPPGSLDEEDEEINSDPEWENVEFAPSDYEPFLCDAKNNFCGLGYEGLDKRLVLSGNSIREEIIDPKKGRKFGSQAFGVGAFEEEDEDVYERDDMSGYYFSLGKDESGDVKPLTDSSSFSIDGVIEGFSLERKTYIRKIYLLPMLPKDYIPHRKICRSAFEQPSSSNNEKFFKGAKTIHKSDKNVLEKASQEENEGAKLVKKIISNVKVNESRFKPFVVNPEKQERYEAYLKLIEVGKKELLCDLQPLSMSNWEREREKIEFEKAALLFRPFTGGMEERFSTATQPDDLSDPLASVDKYVDQNDDRQKAVKLKMYGMLTRRTEDWTPEPLLCKRFNIPEPKNSQFQKSKNQKRKSYLNLFDSTQNREESVEEFDKSEKSSVRKSDEIAPEILQTKQENTIDSKNKTDLFKAIFLDTDDEEKSSEDKTEKAKLHSKINSENTENAGSVSSYEEKLMNSKGNLSPPKGIFAGIDILESLSKMKNTKETVSKQSFKEEAVRCRTTQEPSPLSSNLVYGPQIPENITAKSDFVLSKVSDDGIWVEKKNRIGKKHKKKDKKSKSSHKSKHKSKHKRR